MKLRTLDRLKPHFDSHRIIILEEEPMIRILLTKKEKRDIVISEYGVRSKKSRIIEKKFKQAILTMIDEAINYHMENINA